MKKQILFVDDEPNILRGLKDRLRRQRKKWDMSFVGGGEEALKILNKQHFDVIVSDMRMPKMDGATLLKEVQDHHPEVVRIVLSGYAELETALRAVPVAHQFLTKPCYAGVLENVVERACNLQSLINDDVVRRTVGKIETLPSLPRVYSELVTALANESVSTDEVAEILKSDMAMCAKVLQMVNSAFFRLSRTISKIEDAVAYLGFNAIKQVALAVEVFRQSHNFRAPHGFSPEQMQEHALSTAKIASRMFKDRGKRDDVFIAAMLHDVGKLLLVMELPEHFEKVTSAARADGCPMHVAEERLSGVTHAEVGAYLLGLWGLPYSIVEAVANHHSPQRVDQREFDVLAAIHVADALAHEQEGISVGDGDYGGESLDSAYVEFLGISSELEEWRRVAREEAEAVLSSGRA